MREINYSIVSNFIDDVNNILKEGRSSGLLGSYSWSPEMYVTWSITYYGLVLNAYEENGLFAHKVYDRCRLVERLMSDKLPTVIKRYNNLFNYDKISAIVSGEGEYKTDYFLNLQIIFRFSDNVDSIVWTSGLDLALKSIYVLFERLDIIKRGVDIVIRDFDGTSCQISDYVKYVYSSGDIHNISSRYKLSDKELEDIKIRLEHCLIEISNLGYPLEFIKVSRYRYPGVNSRAAVVKSKNGKDYQLWGQCRKYIMENHLL